jgi:hypothetical protein
MCIALGLTLIAAKAMGPERGVDLHRRPDRACDLPHGEYERAMRMGKADGHRKAKGAGY